VDTEDTARLLAPYLAPDTNVVSLQNGVDNAERMDFAAGIQAISAVVYIAAEMSGSGQVKHSGRGDLVIGNPASKQGASESELAEIAEIFIRSGVPCRVSQNITLELWKKLIMNCAYNALSALSRARYGRLVDDAGSVELMNQVVAEGVAVGNASGVRLPADMLIAAVLELGRVVPEALSSTAQDIARGKSTEIDSLNGFLVRRGAEMGVPTPVNQTLYSLVKLLERTPLAR
jgi:2-dehydropantoate 2-reductase